MGNMPQLVKTSKLRTKEAGKVIKIAKRMCKKMYEDGKRLTESMNNKTALAK